MCAICKCIRRTTTIHKLKSTSIQLDRFLFVPFSSCLSFGPGCSFTPCALLSGSLVSFFSSCHTRYSLVVVLAAVRHASITYTRKAAGCRGARLPKDVAGRSRSRSRSWGRTSSDISHEAFANDEGLDAFSINQMCDIRHRLRAGNGERETGAGL